MVPAIETYGTEPIATLLVNIPVWELDEDVALEIVEKMEFHEQDIFFSEQFLFNFSRSLKHDILFEKFEALFKRELNEMKNRLENGEIVSLLDARLLINIQYQEPALVYNVLTVKLEELYALLELAQKQRKNEKNRLVRYIRHGESDKQRNVNYLTSNIHALLQILHKIRPDEYPEKLVKRTRRSLCFTYRGVFQDGIILENTTNETRFYGTTTTPRDMHVLFSKGGIITHPKNELFDIEVLIIHSDSNKKIVRKARSPRPIEGFMMDMSTISIHVVYVNEEEVIEKLYYKSFNF